MEMVTKRPDAAKRLQKLETVLSGGVESMTCIRNRIGAESRLAAASVCIGRRRNATEHDESGKTKRKGDELQRKDGGR